MSDVARICPPSSLSDLEARGFIIALVELRRSTWHAEVRDSGTSRCCLCCRRTCALRPKRRTVSWRTSVADGAWNGLSDASGAVPGERTPSSAPYSPSHASLRLMQASAVILPRVTKAHSPSTFGSRRAQQKLPEAHRLLRYDGGELSPGLTTRSARSGAATVDAVAVASGSAIFCWRSSLIQSACGSFASGVRRLRSEVVLPPLAFRPRRHQQPPLRPRPGQLRRPRCPSRSSRCPISTRSRRRPPPRGIASQGPPPGLVAVARAHAHPSPQAGPTDVPSAVGPPPAQLYAWRYSWRRLLRSTSALSASVRLICSFGIRRFRRRHRCRRPLRRIRSTPLNLTDADLALVLRKSRLHEYRHAYNCARGVPTPTARQLVQLGGSGELVRERPRQLGPADPAMRSGAAVRVGVLRY